MIEALFNYEFMRNAFIAVLLASLITGIMGTIIVEKRLVSLSGGIAHASFGGIGLGYLLNIEPIIGGLLFATVASLSVGQIQRRTDVRADTVISMFWSAGMALGILFIAMTPGYPPDMTSYLFGDILTVNSLYIQVMLGLVVLTLIIIISIYSYWKLYLFDEEYAKIMGIKTVLLETILYILIALSIVILTKVVGIILALALLTIPTSTAKLYTNHLETIMVLSTVFGIIFGIGGLVISYYINIPSGASIILTAILGYMILVLVKKVTTKRIEE